MIKYYIDTKEFTNFAIFRQELIKKLNNRVSVPNLDMLVFKKENVEYYKDNFGIIIKKGIIPTPVPTPEELLAKAKENKKQEIANARWSEINKGMPYNYKGVEYIADTDDSAKVSILGQLNALQVIQPDIIEWKMQDQVWCIFEPATDFVQFATIVLNWISGRYSKEKILVGLVNDAPTIEDVEKISWDDTEPNDGE